MDDIVEQMKARITRLSAGQRKLLTAILATFEEHVASWRLISSDVVDGPFLEAFGDILKLHHTMSDDYLDKHRFEAAMERISLALGKKASRPARNFPGKDVTIGDEDWSLKTQGDRGIKRELLHISKFMELGKGRWEDVADLQGLRDAFLNHLNGYTRIFQLRYFGHARRAKSDPKHFYELVEIPKTLMKLAESGEFSMRESSKQTPKPGNCVVRDQTGNELFRLYFDGGTERKLQIKNLRKDHCIVHATWAFGEINPSS